MERKRILKICLLSFALVLLGAIFSGCGAETAAPAAEPVPSPGVAEAPEAEVSPEPGATLEPPRRLTLVYRDGHTEELTPGADEAPLSLDCDEPGYCCYAWTDDARQRYESVSAGTDADTLYQRCAVKLPDGPEHRAYFFPEDDGSYALDEAFTRRQAARMFEALLEPTETGDEGFPDLDGADPAFSGAARMRSYGMLADGPFHPEKGVTRSELFRWLSVCYPPAEGVSSPEEGALLLAEERGWYDPEAEAPEEVLTGRELLFLMNRVLARGTEIGDLPAEAYASVADYLEDPALCAALAEAGITHRCAAAEAEQWEDFTVLRRLASGPRYRGNRLSWVGEDGLFVVGREENGLLFDEKGLYTSGDPELDALVLSVLDGILTEDMSQYEKLRAVYDYCVTELRYGGAPVYERETDDWWQEAARKMLSSGRGNCFNFSSAFCALSRPLGYNTKVSAGSTFGQGIHSWAYIMMDGEEHIFDPQSELVYHFSAMFDLTPEQWAWIEYEPVYSGDGAEPLPAEEAAPEAEEEAPDGAA